MRNTKKPDCRLATLPKARTYTHIVRDIRVDTVSDERGCGDGIWIYLKKEYVNVRLDSGDIHEHTVAECCYQLNNEVIER